MARDRSVSTRGSGRGKLLKIALLAVPFLALAAFGGYYFVQYQKLANNPLSSEQVKEAENKRILEAVGKLYTLPKDEDPAILFVKDKSKLTDDEKQYIVVDKAQNGDYQILYSKAKIALLYRPSENRLVDVRPIAIQEAPKVKVIGPEVSRQAVEKKLTDAKLKPMAGADAKGQYESIIVVDLKGTKAEAAANLAKIVGGQVGQLPEGEDRPADADFLVIAGTPVESEPVE